MEMHDLYMRNVVLLTLRLDQSVRCLGFSFRRVRSIDRSHISSCCLLNGLGLSKQGPDAVHSPVK